jgi:hypothetical protein
MKAANMAAMEHSTGDVWRVGCQLERELTAANEMFRKLNIHALNLVDRIRRLEEAGDAVAAIIGPPGSAHWADENQVDAAWNNWTKAKEAKL